ncbi:helix-turn-helix domain-containing protein [Ectobacillus antri]|jgi:excisionase family DNA binding protein|uniref:Helix-turn-helix domain-containing protein n=1 Tax=Ectobacillus antri TaxID=2486280 RepID=A0ABT6H4F0_9BACI|nr:MULTISPECIES: helix-turn-helix domain-containing protein [Ectobacillus]MDG4658096.1 helix-turn-helix domain-containing protein [Ectobacillus antri]MDG5753663.1 helix-turn-helix domain-containing protein [Ectobacillus antri]UOY93297.1 helix-turn-helix domain-containing protein [Ectobacillus sp. JY-23]
MNETEILTAKEIANYLKISLPTAHTLMDDPTFPLIRIGRCKRVIAGDFYSWLKQQASR